MTEPTAEQVDRERERAHVVLRAIFNNEDGPWQCALKDRAHDEDCDIVATALARVRVEAHAAGRDEGLEATIKEQRRQLSILQEAQRERNRQLDAMHWVWCDGGCAGGLGRWSPVELTEELVALAERNSQRLRSWLTNKDFKARFAEARAAGASFEAALEVARDAIRALRGRT